MMTVEITKPTVENIQCTIKGEDIYKHIEKSNNPNIGISDFTITVVDDGDYFIYENEDTGFHIYQKTLEDIIDCVTLEYAYLYDEFIFSNHRQHESTEALVFDLERHLVAR